MLKKVLPPEKKNKRLMGLDALLENHWPKFQADTGRFSNLPYLGMKLCHWQNVSKVLSFYPSGSKLSSFLIYGQRFPRCGPIFEISIFEHETWPLAKVPEVAHILPSTPEGWNWAYFRSTDSEFLDTGRFSKLLYLGMKLGNWPRFQKLHIYGLLTLVGRN